MIIIPAIDLKNGKCVRLSQGEMHRETVYSDNPVETALKWQTLGAERLHIVDLDGAVSGSPHNREAIQQIRAAVDMHIEIGGGIRDMATIESWLDKGLSRVILGTVAVENPDLVRQAARAFPQQIAVGIDARDGKVATKGWAEETDVQATDLAMSFEDAGVAAIIYTDIMRDGAMGGPNTTATADLARSVSIPVIASGGVSSLHDLSVLKKTGVISGAISGRALYDGAIDLSEALALLSR